MPGPAFTIRDGRPEDDPAVRALLERVLEPRSAEMFDWRYHRTPFPTAMFVLCDDADEVVGFAGGSFPSVWIDGRCSPLSLFIDFAVDRPGQGGGRLLIEAMLDRTAAVRYAFPAEHTVDLIAGLGRTPGAGRLPQWVRWATPGALEASRRRAVPRPGRALTGMVLWAVRALSGRPRRLAIEGLAAPGAEIDALAADAVSFAPCILQRDASYLRWRWLDQPGGRWTAHVARGPGRRLRGVVVYGSLVDQLHGGRPVGRIVDLLARDATAARVLIDHAARSLERDGCGMTLCELNDPRPWSKRALRRAGFVARGTGPMFHVAAAPGFESASQRSNWYLTSGDTDLV